MVSEYIALDLETSGLNPKRDRILEIGGARVKNGEIVDTYTVFVNSKIRIPEEITALTGIDNTMIDQGEEPQKAMREFLNFCGDLPILGHNIIFDFSFLKKCAVNLGYSFEKKGIDTLKIARKFLEELPSRKLDAVCSYYGIPVTHHHRAYHDAVAASQLFEAMKKEFYQIAPEAFLPSPLCYQVKKEGPITKSQKGYLNDLVKYHRIELQMSIDSLTKNEASRIIDGIILNHGKIKR